MQNREQKNCFNCGAPVEIVPAGVSKKTGKPYGSFAKCKECGRSESIGVQPPKQTGASKDFIVTELKKINERLDGMARLMQALAQALTKRDEPNIPL